VRRLVCELLEVAVGRLREDELGRCRARRSLPGWVGLRREQRLDVDLSERRIFFSLPCHSPAEHAIAVQRLEGRA
jgi:hypothetical protein